MHLRSEKCSLNVDMIRIDLHRITFKHFVSRVCDTFESRSTESEKELLSTRMVTGWEQTTSIKSETAA